MSDYPFLKLYTTRVLRDIRGLSLEEVGLYLIKIIDNWDDGRIELLPEWLQSDYLDLQAKSKACKESALKRWQKPAYERNANAMRTHSERIESHSERNAEKRREDKSIEENTDNTNTENKSSMGTKQKKERAVAFAKPTLSEVQIFVVESGSTIDAERFWNYYESNGWRVGRNPMKDWKATVRTWGRTTQGSITQQPQRKNRMQEMEEWNMKILQEIAEAHQ